MNWRKKQNLKKIPEKNSTYLANSQPHLALLEPIALFGLLLNDEIRGVIATETKRYASQQNELFYLQQHELIHLLASFRWRVIIADHVSACIGVKTKMSLSH